LGGDLREQRTAAQLRTDFRIFRVPLQQSAGFLL
jgi:hypothetical protein